MVWIRVTKIKAFSLLVLLLLLLQSKGYSQGDKNLYYQGIKAAREGEIDFAFIHFNKLLSDFPESKYREHALFGTGEYYFSNSLYGDAIRTLNKFINNYPESEARPFAIAYLLKLAQRKNQEDIVEKLKKELISFQQSSLLFRDFKELKYLSPLYKNYRALNFIDKIEIYIDDELFAKISF